MVGSAIPATVTVTQSDVVPELDNIAKAIQYSVPIQDLTVSGQLVIDQSTVVKRRISFESGAELIFSSEAQRKNSTLYLIAGEIVSRDPTRPGRISAQIVVPQQTQAEATGSGTPGQNGGGDGSPGGVGGSGQPGTTGLPGPNGPKLVIFAPTFKAARIIVQLDGGPGGTGGRGGNGGVGGAGARGESASQSAFDCRRGAGHGGDGGAGGNGGNGGAGGNGGNGGALVIISEDPVVQGVLFHADGGPGGLGGPPGIGGPGGLAGPQGPEQLPWCQGGHGGGSNGARGAVGVAGPIGQPGDSGHETVAPVSHELIVNIGKGLGLDCAFLSFWCK
jgi:hypothetical protein